VLTSHILKSAAAAAVLLAAGSAPAAVVELNLTGHPADFVPFTQDFPGLHLDRGTLALSGFDPMAPVVVEQGDEIRATVTFDADFTVPASVDVTQLLFFLTGSDFQGDDTETSGSITFFLDGLEVATGPGGRVSSGQLVTSLAFNPPNNGAFTFDAFTSNFFVTTLSGPVTLDSATADYVLFDFRDVETGVPEPATWAMMLLGFGGLGAVLRRRRFGAGVAGALRT